MGLSVLTNIPEAQSTGQQQLQLTTSTTTGTTTSTCTGSERVLLCPTFPFPLAIPYENILNFLESINMATATDGFNNVKQKQRNDADKSMNNSWHCPLNIADVIFPLTSGQSIRIAYLEWLIYINSIIKNNNTSSPFHLLSEDVTTKYGSSVYINTIESIHDEYAKSLLQHIPHQSSTAINSTEIISPENINEQIDDNEDVILYKIYRKKLQYFLQFSNYYHPEIVMKFLPGEYLHEFALILSKLNRHEEVLRIYIHQLQDVTLAEEYCHTNYLFYMNKIKNDRLLVKKASPTSISTTAQSQHSQSQQQQQQPTGEEKSVNYQKIKLEQDILDEKAFMSLIGDTNNVYIWLFKVSF